MKKISYVLLLFCFTLPFFVNGQQKPDYVGQWYQRSAEGKRPIPADLLSPGPSDFARTKRYNLKANLNQLNSILRTAPALLNLTVPYGDKTYTLNLARVEVTGSRFNVRTNQGNAQYTKGVQYRGIVDNNPAQIASLSLTPNDISAYFSTGEGNFVITKEGLEYIVYNDNVLVAPTLIFCQTPDTLSYQIPTQSSLVTGIGCKTVNVYMECDYAFYQAKGSSVSNVADYVLAFFNQVATLYANENVAVQVSEIFVWNTPDPYVAMTSTSDILSAFRTNRGTTFNGDLAHFLTTRNVGGGVAYVDVLCNKAYAYGVSMVYSYYNNFPTYSWTVEVVTHELGHGMGSPHTHSCSWSTGALDNCYTPEGSCSPGPAPTNGGTIMSYCHLTNYGINFNNGFGFYPGNRIRDRVLNATCIAGGTSSTPPTSLSTTNVTSTSATLNWVAASGATNYTVQYKLSTASTWTAAGSTQGTTLDISGLTANTNYVWTVRSDCSDYAPNASFTTSGTTTTTGCSAPAGLTSSNVGQNSATLNWGAVNGATNYTVQYKAPNAADWTTSTTSSNTVVASGLTAGTTYTWQVKADCSSYSAQASFTTTSAPTATVCTPATNLAETNIANGSATLGWTGASNAQSYSVRLRESGSKRWLSYNATTNSLNVTKLRAGKMYEWMVDTKCTDGTSSGYTATKTFTAQ